MKKVENNLDISRSYNYKKKFSLFQFKPIVADLNVINNLENKFLKISIKFNKKLDHIFDSIFLHIVNSSEKTWSSNLICQYPEFSKGVSSIDIFIPLFISSDVADYELAVIFNSPIKQQSIEFRAIFLKNNISSIISNNKESEITFSCNLLNDNESITRYFSDLTKCSAANEDLILNEFNSRDSLKREYFTNKSNSYLKIFAKKNTLPLPPLFNRFRVAGHIAKKDKHGKLFIKENLIKSAQFLMLYEFFSNKQCKEKKIMDFGVGCGGVARNFINSIECDYYGLDIDQINIDWCNSNLQQDKFFITSNKEASRSFFKKITPNSFDFLLSYSVMTHLKGDLQDLWMKRLVKIMKKDSFMIFSVHSISSLISVNNRRLVNLIQNKSFFSNLQNPDIADQPGSEDYIDVANSFCDIIERWSKYVKIIDIISFNDDGHHDFIICCPK